MSQKKIASPNRDQFIGEETLHLLFSSHPIPMLVVDLKTLMFLDVNDAALKKYGYSRDEFLQLNMSDIHASENSGEQRHLLKNGETIDMEVISHPFEAGEKGALMVIMQDITQRKQAEEKLRESEETLRVTLENISDPVFITDEEGNFTFICPNFIHNLHYSVEDIWAMGNISALIGRDAPTPNNLQVQEGLSNIEKTIFDKNGGQHTFLMNRKHVSIGKGTRLYTLHDITKHKQAEEALLESKLTSERYLNIAAGLIVSLDREGNITHLNDSGHKLLGYTPPQLIGKNWLETCLSEEDRDESRHLFGVLKSGETEGLEAHESAIITKSGERKTILWHNTILRDEEGRFMGILSSGEDITERIEMEKVLRIALAKYKTLFECFPLGITITDKSGNILETNPTAARLLAVSREEHSKRSVAGTEWRIVRPDGTPMPSEEFASVRALKEQQIIENVEMGIIKSDHSITWLSVTAAPMPQEGHGVVITYSDITARKRTDDTLQARVRLSLFSESHTLDQLLQKTLDEAEALTGSQIGFAHFLQEDQKTLELQMWSTNTLKNMCTAEGKGQHYPVDKAGVWVDCVYTRAPIIHNDYSSLSHRKGLPPGHAPVTRELVVPVIRGELIVAIFGVGNKPNDYTSDDVDTVLQLANLTWDIIQRKRAEEALRENQELFSLFIKHSPIYAFIKEVTPTASRVLQASENYEEMIGIPGRDMIGKTMEDLFPPDVAAKFTSDDREVVTNGRILKLDEELNERNYTTIKFPIIQGDKTLLAGYTIDITERKRAEKELEAANIELKASLIREHELSHTDMLTGVNNRRNLYEIATREFEIAARYRQPLSLMLFDLDHFKKVNDSFGHAVGDQMLAKVTQAATAELRSADSIGRYGGEEFVILLPMTNAQHAFSLAERIRERVAKVRVPTPLGEASVTLSIGIVEMNQKTSLSESVDDLIRRADRAMYTAKQSGRNRSIIFTSDLTQNMSKSKT